MSEKDLLTISEAAEILGVSIDTLRRWDKSGKLNPAKISDSGYRLYDRIQIELFLNDLFGLAKDWVLKSIEIPATFYCSNSAEFQTRLIRMQSILEGKKELAPIFTLVVAVAGEIGNNSFDHNLGNWPDTPGIFFAYDAQKKKIILADRGLGIFTTLKRVKPGLNSDEEALKVAFTEIISGRSPENRGNGLKFVSKIAAENPIGLLFQTGNAELILAKESTALNIRPSPKPFRGCLALITF
ncbi:MerR family DNA-binding transcriptional regulator [Candidatus Giovannonibacteria bacterium]|nr:MerR family DNA-binding transcriptional regulator [Candidatus Giovannonibacteria bacterium]